MPKISNRILFRTPAFSNYYLNHYASVKFWICKLKHSLNLLKPTTFVQWLATYDCNFACGHCEASAGKKGDSELTTEQVLSLVDELAGLKIKHMFISGGEPLVREDLFEIISYLLKKDIGYGIASNGYLVDSFKKQFTKNKPNLFFTSIDGLAQTNDQLRGMNGAFNRSISALAFFKSIGVDERWVNTLVYPGNMDQLQELKKHIKDSEATLWRLALAIPAGRAINNDKMYLNNEQIGDIFAFIENTRKELNITISEDAGCLGPLDLNLKSHPFFCGAGLTRCSVMPDGEILGCQIAYDNQYSEGNIKKKSFSEIWQKGFSRFRNPEFDATCSDCKYFHRCRGGCWGMRLGGRHCYKDVWEKE